MPSFTMDSRKQSRTLLLLAGAFFAGVSHANFIQNGGFESTAAGTTFVVSDFVVNSASTYGKWLDQNTWATVSGDGTDHPLTGAAAAPTGYTDSNWGRQFPGSPGNTTQTLMQGFDASGLASGTELRLEFDYIRIGAQTASFAIYGLDAGESWSRFPPNPCTNCDLLSGLLPALTSGTQGWAHYDQTFTLPRTFQAIAIGFTFGSNTAAGASPLYVGGIDEVSITATSVPEPATLSLIGLSLAGFGYLRRKQAKA